MHRILAAALLLITAAGCTAHKLEIQQGNIVSKEKLDLVKPGMDQQQVRFALGTPLIQDPFHANRWDYYYQLTEQGKEQVSYRVTLHFSQGRLERIEEQGAVPPNERAALEAVRTSEIRRE